MRLRYCSQRDALAEALERDAGDLLDVEVPDQGMHLIARLRGNVSDVAVEQAALRTGVIVRAVSRLHVAAPSHPALMLGFSGYPVGIIVPAAARLAGVVRVASRSATVAASGH